MASIHDAQADLAQADRFERDLESTLRRHGPEVAMQVVASALRGEAQFLTRWLGTATAYEIIQREADRIVSDAAAPIAVPWTPPTRSHSRNWLLVPFGVCLGLAVSSAFIWIFAT